MKKYLYIALAAAALTSCSSDDTLDVVQGEQISFSNAYVGNSTRATDDTYGPNKLVEKFNVYGTVTGTAGTVNIFNGNDVTKPTTITNAYDATKAWECAGTAQYWIAGANYQFAAIVNEDIVTVTYDQTTGMPTKLSYTTDSLTTKDLLYATASVPSASASQGLVAFSFDHLLSKVKFTVKSNAPEGYHYSVENIKIANYETAEYNIANSTWTGNTAHNFNFGPVREVTAKTGEKTNAKEMLLIPNTADYAITFTVNLYVNGKLANSDNYSSTVSHDLVKGNSYNFVIDLSIGNQIQFTIQNVKGWVDGNDNPSTNDVTETFIPVTLTPAN